MPKFMHITAVLVLGLSAACAPNNGDNQQVDSPPTATAAPSQANPQASTAPAAQVGDVSEAVSVSLGYVGADAWLVTEVGGAQNLTELDAQNPTLQLEVGKRYTFSNPQAQVHPFALRDAADSYLLAQGSTEGALEQDADIDFVDDGTTVAFTLTQALADRVATYICVVHPPMVGDVTVASSE